ncbi:MAG: RusA family crossover junction endodeoxyribonuclease [Fusobacteriaceae bacterium]
MVDADRIIHTLDKYRMSTVIPVDGHPLYDSKLHICIHGTPISDSRPRLSKQKDYFYNPHKEALKKLFNHIYKTDTVLQETCITSPHQIDIRFYLMPDKDAIATFGKDMISTDNIESIGVKDNDNIEKVHWDVLQDAKFRVILDDRNIIANTTKKFYSYNPRIEIDILFCTDPDNELNNKYMRMITKKKVYRIFILSPKYLNNHYDTDIEKAHFFVDNVKNAKFTKKEQFINHINQYPVSLLYEICKIYLGENIHLMGKTKEKFMMYLVQSFFNK